MTYYLIEFRFQGRAKKRVKSIILEVKRKFGIRTKRDIPHITLIGPLYCKNERRLITVFEQTCKRYNLMFFKIQGFGSFFWNSVIYFNIEPSEELERFRVDLCNQLKSFCRLNLYDYRDKFYYHATIVKKIGFLKYFRIKNHIAKRPIPKLKQFVIRITLIKNQIILREYDFPQKKSLTRYSAKSRIIYRKTLSLLMDRFKNHNV